MFLLGIDIGTSGAKVAIFDSNGIIRVKSHCTYPLISPERGAMELDPEAVFKAVMKCIVHCTKRFDISKVTAISFSSQGEAMVPIDNYGNPLFHSIVTFDSRNKAEYKAFSNKLEREEAMKITGMPIHSMFSATKLMWLKNHHPEVYESTWKFLCFGDYIAFRLGGASAIDYSMAARTMMFDLRTKKWSDEILAISGIDVNKLPEPQPTGTVIGTVNHLLVGLGFSKDCKIVLGSHDQLCCSLGAGVLKSGQAMDTLGTTESILCVSHELNTTSDMLKHNIPVYNYPLTNMYAYMTFLSGCASQLRWFKEMLLTSDCDDFYHDFDVTANRQINGPTSIYVMPHFSGTGTPALNDRAKGMIYGLTLDTDKYQIYKAIIEGTCYESRYNIENMEACGMPIDSLYCIGGGAKSALWLQLKADITGKKVYSMACDEAGCQGAAMIAAVGSGAVNSLDEINHIFVRVKHIYMPNPVMQAKYQSHYVFYKQLYKQAIQLADFS